MQTQTLRPGLLVSLSIRLSGNVNYNRLELEPEHVTADGTKRARWETERVIEDAAEHDRAWKVRSQCRGAISRVCTATTFGLLCPEDRRAELDEAVRSAQAMAAEFNSGARLTRVGVYVITGRIAPDDLEAVRAINSEVRALMTEMEEGLKNLDVSAVRAAAGKARSLGHMLSPEAAERIKTAVDSARDMARKIVKASEEASVAIDREALKKIAESRTAFLDLDEAPAEVAKPAAQARAVDLEPEHKAEEPPKKLRRRGPAAPQMEI